MSDLFTFKDPNEFAQTFLELKFYRLPQVILPQASLHLGNTNAQILPTYFLMLWKCLICLATRAVNPHIHELANWGMKRQDPVESEGILFSSFFLSANEVHFWQLKYAPKLKGFFCTKFKSRISVAKWLTSTPKFMTFLWQINHVKWEPPGL